MCVVAENQKHPKAAICVFDGVEFRKLYDLRKIVKLRSLTTTELDISPRPYGKCCRSKSDPVGVSCSIFCVKTSRL